MQKYGLFLLLVLVMMACGGSLSDEQRKELREGRAKQKVKRVAEAQILEQAFSTGRKIVNALVKDSTATQKIAVQYKSEIYYIKPGQTTALAIEQQLIEAYLMSIIDGGMADNVQKIPGDSMMYTFPVADTLADGAVSIQGMWSVHMAVKDLILSME